MYNKRVTLIYNPTIAPQHFGSYIFPPKGYFLVPAPVAEALAETSIPVLIENHSPDFPVLWVTYPVY